MAIRSGAKNIVTDHTFSVSIFPYPMPSIAGTSPDFAMKLFNRKVSPKSSISFSEFYVLDLERMTLEVFHKYYYECYKKHSPFAVPADPSLLVQYTAKVNINILTSLCRGVLRCIA
jgi:hypothetical protein